MTEADVKNIVKSEFTKLMKDQLDKEMKLVLQKSNSASRNELIKTIKDSMEAVYKVLWQKREFWKTDIK
jgi:hypothetical protein